MADTLGSKELKPVPPEIDRWNWGAFLLNWIWGIGNGTYIALLTLIPLVGFVMLFVLGAKGSRWAWRNGRWDSVEHFKRVQRGWAIWGAVIWIGFAVLFAGIFGGVSFLLKNSAAYQQAIARLQTNPDAIATLGTPISAGTPSGSIATSNGSGQATLYFSVNGSKATGHVHVAATEQNNVWTLNALTLSVDGRDDVIDLLRENRAENSFWSDLSNRQAVWTGRAISVKAPT